MTGSTSLPLDVIRDAARRYVALQGSSQTNLYLRPSVWRAGDVIGPSRLDLPIERDCIVVFCDDDPLKNWGHACRFLLHDPTTGAMQDVIPASLPPSFDFTKEFEPFHAPAAFNLARGPLRALRAMPPKVFAEPATNWYAILYSGWSNACHVNDLEFLYRTLTTLYRVPASNVTVLNADGTPSYIDDQGRLVPVSGNWPGDNTPYRMRVTGPGTGTALLNALGGLGSRLQPTDNVLLHTSNHCRRLNGDVHLISYGVGPDTLPDDLAGAIGALRQFAGLMVMMQQCYSGAFLAPILASSPADRASVATAVDATHESFQGNVFNPFALYWISAMAGAQPDGSALPTNTDPSGTGVSARTAFDYAKSQDQTGEQPCFNDAAGGGELTLQSNRAATILALEDRFPGAVG